MHLVAGALYLGGRIARVQRQALPEDMPLYQRGGDVGYPDIPSREISDGILTSAMGCSAPIHNAAPASVVACASLIAQSTIDVLTTRFDMEDEVIDVYRAISERPFHRLGRVDGDYK